MSDFQIDDHELDAECAQLAADIYAEFMEGKPAENPEDYRGDMSDRAHEAAAGHQWVIYTYKAIRLCASCDIAQGEEFLQDAGLPEDVTFGSLATTLAYGEIRARIDAALSELIDAWEEPEEPEELAD